MAAGTSLGLILTLLLIKLITKWIGIWPLAQWFRFSDREGTYTTLLMSTGLTFGTINASFGLTHGYVDSLGTYHTYISREQYSILVTVIVGSTVVPTLIAQRFFRPEVGPAVPLEPVSRARGVAVPETATGREAAEPAAAPREHDWRWRCWWH